MDAEFLRYGRLQQQQTEKESAINQIMGTVTVILRGGLGNQMFQYAFGRSLAEKNNLQLVLDTQSGFVRDKIYKRKFLLDRFSLHKKTRLKRSVNICYLYELFLEKIGSVSAKPINRRFYGVYVKETIPGFVQELMETSFENANVLVNGFWQDERYFLSIEELLIKEFAINVPVTDSLRRLGEKLHAETAVGIGIRLFEEMPGEDKSGVGGFTELSFYRKAINLLLDTGKENQYFIFSTKSIGIKEKLELPGIVEYITEEEGYKDELETFWLLSRSRKLVIANSSFFWWGAWFAEKNNLSTHIISSKNFPAADTVPERWRKEWHTLYPHL